MYDIIIVGAGPAGLTAALYALRANKKVLVFEAKSYGGQIIKANKIENYPGIDLISGFDFATNLYNQVKKFGGEIKYETVINIDDKKTVVTTKDKYEAKAIIIATGSFNRRLNIDNEENLVGKGISYCATCDGNFYKGKKVAVIGSGESALTDAYYLSDIVDKVYIINKYDKFKTELDYSKNLEERNNIEVIYSAKVEKLNGVDSLKSIDVILEDGEKINIIVDGAFIDVGQEPKNDIFKNVVDIDEKGYIISTDGVHTKTKGIYVAGDTRVKELRQLTTAVSDGSLAATIAIKELNK